METFLQQTFLGNSYQDYAWFLGWLIVGFLFEKIFLKVIIKMLVRLFNKYTKDVDANNFVDLLEKPLRLILFLLFLLMAFSHLSWPENWELVAENEFGVKMLFKRLFLVVFGLSLAYFLVKTADCLTLILLKKAEKTVSKQDDQLVPFLSEILKIFIWVIAILVILSYVFKLNVGTLVAGLGIGGLAIALAAQDTLTNLLGSFTIFFDKPFVVGDLVTVGNITGVVEKVGFRSTRIRTLERSYVTLPNEKNDRS